MFLLVYRERQYEIIKVLVDEEVETAVREQLHQAEGQRHQQGGGGVDQVGSLPHDGRPREDIACVSATRTL